MQLDCDGITGSVDCWPCISVIDIQPHPQGKGKRPLGRLKCKYLIGLYTTLLFAHGLFFTSFSVSPEFLQLTIE